MIRMKQQQFADEYIRNGGNGAQAYKAVCPGVTDESAMVGACRWLSNVNLQEYIKKRNEELKNDRIADLAEIKEFFSATLRNPQLRTADRLKAAELLAKTEGAFLERREVDNAVTIQIDGVDEEWTL